MHALAHKPLSISLSLFALRICVFVYVERW